MYAGGDNTPLNENKVIISTPGRLMTPQARLMTPQARLMTPQYGVAGSITPGQTPVRDLLSINTDDVIESFSDSDTSLKQQHLEMHAQLKAGLGSLPAPKNDFEIVVPENDSSVEPDLAETFVEDAAEIEERNNSLKKLEGDILSLCTC